MPAHMHTCMYAHAHTHTHIHRPNPGESCTSISEHKTRELSLSADPEDHREAHHFGEEPGEGTLL